MDVAAVMYGEVPLPPPRRAPAPPIETVGPGIKLIEDPATTPPEGLRLVLVSDTHGLHRQLAVPPGDVLVHAGDFTRYGREEDAQDFGAWLKELPHAHKIVAFGNHEANAPWRRDLGATLPGATTLCNGGTEVPLHDEGAAPLRLFAPDFCWPMHPSANNPAYSLIPAGVDVLVTHGPVKGHLDGEGVALGCPCLLEHVRRARPRLVVCGHIHGSHGACWGKAAGTEGTLFVNAANAAPEKRHVIGWAPVVVDLVPRVAVGAEGAKQPP
mmetsp:Transcript_11338/g.38645  ORF Transcript_11338/g.38645 Transcript_11338/m.38645 type:complete len:269 (+) Transcript_11338:47-853(+)